MQKKKKDALASRVYKCFIYTVYLKTKGEEGLGIVGEKKQENGCHTPTLYKKKRVEKGKKAQG